DVDDFERAYLKEHLPMARTKLAGATKIALTKIIGSADGSIPPFYQIAEIDFPSIKALQSCAATEGAKETVAHAISISNGGPPLFMIAETETIAMDSRAVV
ncbi:MAG TPA: EthD family reductase, partial [Candidatus Acidoferrum sp.]|nr:EthD family reductase [Candidatus Acidoferrum sp.]